LKRCNFDKVHFMLLARLREVGSEGNRHHHDDNYEPRCRLERWSCLPREELVIFAHFTSPDL